MQDVVNPIKLPSFLVESVIPHFSHNRMKTLDLTSSVHVKSFAVRLPKLLKYFTFSSCFFICRLCLEYITKQMFALIISLVLILSSQFTEHRPLMHALNGQFYFILFNTAVLNKIKMLYLVVGIVIVHYLSTVVSFLNSQSTDLVCLLILSFETLSDVGDIQQPFFIQCV